MKSLILAVALLSGTAVAQIPGAGEGAGAMIGAGINQQVPGTALDRTLGGVNGQVRAIDESARESARDASDRASGAADARVEARAGVRVARETRCYDATGDFDPYRRGDHYYCERPGPGLTAGAKVKTVER